MTAIRRDEYLNEDFDYTRLTKQELRQIMSENNVEDIPPVTALKPAILEAYRRTIHDRIGFFRGNFSSENIFQSSAEDGLSSEEDLLPDASAATIDTRHTSAAQQASFLSEPALQANRVEVRLRPPEDRRKQPSKQRPTISLPAAAPNNSLFSAASGSVLNATGDAPDASISQSPSKQATTAPTKPATKTGLVSVRRILLLLTLSALGYLRFFCPYCRSEKQFCIPVPLHARLDGSRLQAEPGWRIVNSVVTHCVVDETERMAREKTVRRIIRMLEYIKGGQEFGYTLKRAISIDELTDDPKVRDLLLRSPQLVVQDGSVEAHRARIGVRTVAHYYFMRLVRIFLPLLILFVFIKFILRRRSRRLEMRKRAADIAGDVNKWLARQLVAASKSDVFKPYIYEIQLRDSLSIKDDLWAMVRAAIEKNTNVESRRDEETGRVRWMWVGPILSKTELGDQ